MLPFFFKRGVEMILDDVKRELRVTNAAFNSELQDLIDAALIDLHIPQINPDKITETDPLIKRAVILYCKANFGLENPDAEKYQKAYDNLVEKLSLSLKYKDVSE